MIASTKSRLEDSSDPQVNEQICAEIRATVARYEMANPREVTYRLAELDQEWDIERVLEFNFSSAVLAGMALGTLSNRKWYLLPGLAACFMVQHVLQGWCPPLVVLRRLGFRTAAEINRERMALKFVRGDFAELGIPGLEQSTIMSVLHAIDE